MSYAEMTDRQRAVWSAGDWNLVAENIAAVSEVVVERLGVQEGHDYLDVATGNGTAALLGAARGARATGLDFVPAWVESARRRAQEAGIEATFVVGDAQDLPFDDDSFDRVSSVFGAMFAPDQERAARELVRVCRPGGAVAVTAWTPQGLNGRMFKALSEYMPPPPEGFQPPILWGTEERVRELFAGLEVETERVMLRMQDDSFEEYEESINASLGPIVTARALLEPQGRWEQARDELRELYASANDAEGGAFAADAEYLLTVVRP